MHIMNRLPRETGRDYALRILKNNIISLDLEPGSMVSENELASSLGLSRTPVREALIELSKVNIVEIYPQRGSRISLIDSNLVGQAFFMRQTLESEIIKEVCELATEADLERLRDCIRSQEQFLKLRSIEHKEDDSNLTFMELDNHFHEMLYEITQKPLVYNIIQDLVIHFDRVRNLTIHYFTPEAITEQHKEILRALEMRDRYLAVALIRNHLSHFREIQKELIEQYPTYFRSASDE